MDRGAPRIYECAVRKIERNLSIDLKRMAVVFFEVTVDESDIAIAFGSNAFVDQIDPGDFAMTIAKCAGVDRHGSIGSVGIDRQMPALFRGVLFEHAVRDEQRLVFKQ